MVSDTEAGTPQGSPISPLLANIALHVLDEAWATTDGDWGCWSATPTTSSWSARPGNGPNRPATRVAAILAPLGLRLHPDKTRIVVPRQGREGFDFLGFHHRMVESWKWRGRYCLNKWPSPRAMASIRGKVRDRTDRRSPAADLERRGRRSQPRAAGLGHLLPARQLRPSSAPSTATSMSGWPGWPAANTGSEGQLDAAGSTRTGSRPSASTGSPERCATGLRMPDDERCRRAVCGRTACTVR